MTGKRPARNDKGKIAMSIKHASSVNNYTTKVAQIQNAISNIQEWLDSLPAKDDNHAIPNIDYGHLGTIEHIHNLLGQVSQATDGFNE